MSNVKRYDFSCSTLDGLISEKCDDGDYVEFSDYAALLARHNALVEAASWERECECVRNKNRMFRNWPETVESERSYNATRAEVDRILEDSNRAEHNKYLEACLEDRNAEMMKHVRMYEALEDEVLWLLDIDDAWRVSCTRETDDAWVESQTSFTLARAEINKLLKENNNE